LRNKFTYDIQIVLEVAVTELAHITFDVDLLRQKYTVTLK